ncbi:MAG TPA: signal peptidase II [Acidobacteriota bacterium]|nr:signal peptidase II [Acidobacteriota bacterium]
MRWIAPLCGLLIFLADWLTKRWAQSALPGRPVEVLEGYFRLRYVENEGIAFGLMHDLNVGWKPYLLGLAAVAALLLVLYYVRTTPKGERLLFVCFGLLLGGITGNFYDRLAHGSVVDFVELHWRDAFYWPTFNVADASITCGVLLILLHTFLTPADEPAEAAEARPSGAAGRGAWLLPLLLIFPPALRAAQEQRPAELLERVQQRYQDIRGFSAEFRQVTHDRGLTQSEAGSMVMEKPGKMYWEYRDPDEKYFVSDGRRSYFYDVAQRQVIISDLDLEAEDTPLLFLLGKGNLRDRFQVEWAPEDEPREQGHEVLRLRPLRPREDFEELLMEVDPGSGLIRRLSVIDPLGARTDYILSDLKINPDVPKRRFRFDMPKGVETIEP